MEKYNLLPVKINCIVTNNQNDYTLENIASHFDKTVRGVKTVLTRRGLACADYTPKAVQG